MNKVLDVKIHPYHLEKVEDLTEIVTLSPHLFPITYPYVV